MIEFSFKVHDSPAFSNYEHDSSKIKEMLLKTHPFLSNCPKLIQTICSTTQSKYSLDTIKSLVSKAFTGTDIRIKDNLTTLLQIHEKNPICRAAKVFLEQYHKEILELVDHPEEVDAKFSFFEEQNELSPLLPFFKEIREEFIFCSKSTEQSFQIAFEKAVYAIALIPPVTNGLKNIIHQSDGHCTGTFFTHAVPLKGMNAAFTQISYEFSYFFNFNFDENITSNFGKKFLEADLKVLAKKIPETFKAVSRIINAYPQAQFNYAELIGKIAIGRLFATHNPVLIDEKALIYAELKSEIDFKMQNLESFKIVGLYILNHWDEFEEHLPDEINPSTSPIDIGEWAYIFATDVTLQSLPCWGLIVSMFFQVNKTISLNTYIERRGLMYDGLIEFNKPFEDIETYLDQIDFSERDHYEIAIHYKNGNHALSLGFKDHFFTFFDPNHYDPVTYKPVIQTFDNRKECFAFIKILVSTWYLEVKTFAISKYSEIPTPTQQMHEYQFGQNLAKRSLLINEAAKLDNWCILLKEKLGTVKSAEEVASINTKIAQINGDLESIQKDLHQFQVTNRPYIEEKISLYLEKNKIQPSKSYPLVIESLRELLIPVFKTT